MSDVLVLEHVCKSFGARPVVQDVSFSVGEGEIFGFLGPNGAGKTTTIKMILGLLSIDSGRILVGGKNIETEFEEAMRSISGIVENPDMYGYLSGYDNLLIHAHACGVDPKRVDEVAELVGMQMRIREKFKSYSLGMKQRLGVAQALLHNPKVMILDEPTNGLDPAGIKDFRDLLRRCWCPAISCRKCSSCATGWGSSAAAACSASPAWKSLSIQAARGYTGTTFAPWKPPARFCRRMRRIASRTWRRITSISASRRRRSRR